MVDFAFSSPCVADGDHQNAVSDNIDVILSCCLVCGSSFYVLIPFRPSLITASLFSFVGDT